MSCSLDLVMPGLSGQDTLQRLIERRPDLPVIAVYRRRCGIDTVVQAMRAGAVDFFVKPASPERIADLDPQCSEAVGPARRSETPGQENRRPHGLRGHDRQRPRHARRRASRPARRLVLDPDPHPRRIRASARKSSRAVSRRLRARRQAVHLGQLRRHSGEPGRVRSCSATRKGSFTGATDKKLGKFVEADGGTLFLDEVGELPLDMQVKLLRVLQEGEVDAVGSRRPTKIDVRIISATNR